MSKRTYQQQKAAQKAYDERNYERRKAQKRRWWQANKGHYGTREEYIATMKATGGMGYTGRAGKGQDFAREKYGRRR